VFTAPKSEIARDLILPKALAASAGSRKLRIIFDGQSSFRPVIANLVLECAAPVNIMFADTKDIDGIAYGQMVISLPEDEKMVEKILAWFAANNVTYREEI
ncbi:MAG: NIL domain-containing protein, partial [Parasporobacterium sp.]|nr:NIL domain-containing protein [Parasporobacterium sp.]